METAFPKAQGTPIAMGEDFYYRLPPELQALAIKHENRPIKGTGPQTLYTYTPVHEAGEKDKS
ncbi:MAG: hypothetical protein AUG51_26025 [Acidobacteria bacterium 13_1_20CM_3_53_8]|nr:MAG: hypothetical protein AUG51_26025 [Acidobacteria bacterium 13_1_20CM_3_53_8]